MSNILCNKIQTPDGTILQSFNRHDYKTHIDANGQTYMVDGGLTYLRRSVNEEAPATDMCVYDTDSHEVIREAFCWGTRGPLGDQPLKYVPLCELTETHIQAVLDTQWQIASYIRKQFTNELAFRGVKK